MAVSFSLADLNRMERGAFVDALGGVFERSPWVAEAAWAARPFASVGDLHAAMAEAVRTAPAERQLALLLAHPDLAGRAARAGTLGDDSRAEQAAAGLDRLTDEEYERFARLNASYRARFGFPFIIAARQHDQAAILAAFARRLDHEPVEEMAAALRETCTIARLRLEALVVAPRGGRGLTTHVLDTARGRPGAGMRLDLSVVEGDERPRLLKTVTTNADGRTDAPLLAAGELRAGRYELAFHVGAYFRRAGVPLDDPPFLDVVTVRFAVADPEHHHHVPLLVSPWSYTTYRGS